MPACAGWNRLWKSIISNKALLPLLWEMFPDHPNLLPAYFAEDEHPPMDKYVVKPIFSREGANVSIIENGKTIESVEGPYGEEGMIVQQFYPLPKFGDSYTLIGSWLINDQPAGIGIREDRALITRDLSRFYPHILSKDRFSCKPDARSAIGQSFSALSGLPHLHRQHTYTAHLNTVDRDGDRFLAVPGAKYIQQR